MIIRDNIGFEIWLKIDSGKVSLGHSSSHLKRYNAEFFFPIQRKKIEKIHYAVFV